MKYPVRKTIGEGQEATILEVKNKPLVEKIFKKGAWLNKALFSK